jgi:hypothetical protein
MIRAKQPEVSLTLPDGSVREGEECLIYTAGRVLIKARWCSTDPFYIAHAKLPDASPEIKALATERMRTLYGDKK